MQGGLYWPDRYRVPLNHEQAATADITVIHPAQDFKTSVFINFYDVVGCNESNGIPVCKVDHIEQPFTGLTELKRIIFARDEHFHPGNRLVYSFSQRVCLRQKLRHTIFRTYER